jgi:hypothetical protein
VLLPGRSAKKVRRTSGPARRTSHPPASRPPDLARGPSSPTQVGGALATMTVANSDTEAQNRRYEVISGAQAGRAHAAPKEPKPSQHLGHKPTRLRSSLYNIGRRRIRGPLNVRFELCPPDSKRKRTDQHNLRASKTEIKQRPVHNIYKRAPILYAAGCF